MKKSSIVGRVSNLALILGVLLTAGCSSSDAGSQNGSLGEKALQSLTPLERTVLADKTVTPGEYQLAVQDTVSCLRTAGFTVSDPVNAPDGTLSFQASYSPPEMATAGPQAPPPDTSKTDAKEASCEQRSTAVQAVYILEHAASEEDAQKAFGVLIGCAESHGVKNSIATDSQDVGKILTEIEKAKRQGLITLDQANRCIDSFRAATLRPLPGLSEALAAYKG